MRLRPILAASEFFGEMESEIIPRDGDAQEDSVSSHSSQSHRAPDERGAKLEKNSSTLFTTETRSTQCSLDPTNPMFSHRVPMILPGKNFTLHSGATETQR